MKKNKLKVRLQKTIAKERAAFWKKSDKVRSNKRLSKFEKKATIDELRGERNFKIALHKKDTSETIFAQNHPSKYDGMTFNRRVTKGKWTNAETGESKIYHFKNKIDYYTVRDESNLDQRISNLLNEDGVKSVLLVHSVKDSEGMIIHVSENFTKSLMERLGASGVSPEEHLTNMLRAKKTDVAGFDHNEYTIRVIY